MDNAPLLAPLDKAPNLGVWLFFRLCRHLLGKVMTPARVIYARMPRLLFPQLLMYRLAARGLSLPPLIIHRVHVRVSLRNRCTFCTDIHQAMALRDGFAHDDFTGLLETTEHLELDPTTSAALAYVDDLCANGRAQETSLAAVRACFSERQIIELTWLYAFTSYLNHLAKALQIGSDGFCSSDGRRSRPPASPPRLEKARA